MLLQDKIEKAKATIMDGAANLPQNEGLFFPGINNR